jgi:zinc protease
MMYAGTPSLSAAGLDDVVAHLGAKSSVTTANDYTVYRLVLPADKLELALRIEADRMQHLTITDADWTRAKRALLAEEEADVSQPLTRLYREVCRAATSAPVCALSALGERGDVARAVSADVRADYQDWYQPNNATLVVSGDVESTDVLRLARAVFGAIPKNDLPDRMPATPFFAYDKRVEVAGDFPYEVVDLAFPAPGSLDADSAAFQIVDAIVNNRRSDFYKALVTSGYTLGYSTQLDQNVHAGLYHVFLLPAPGHSNALVRSAFVDVMKTAQDSGFPDDLVRVAKIAILRRGIYARDSISGLGERVGYATAVEAAPSPAGDDERVAGATANQVSIAVRKFFGAPAVTGLLTPAKGRTPQAPGPPVTSVTDDFSRREPAGRVFEARFVRDLMAAPVALDTRVQPLSFVLPGGLRVLVQEAHANPTVFIEGTAQTSERFDPPGEEGLGAMVSTLLDYGTQSTGSAERRRVLDELGATMDLGLSFDAHGRAQDAGRLIELLADALQHPAFRPADVAYVRKQTLAAIGQRDEDPDYRAGADFDRLLFGPEDPALREPTQASVERITIADLRAYARAYVRPDLTVITIVGDVDPHELQAKMLAAFGAWEDAGPTPDINPGAVPIVQPAVRYVVANRRFAQARLGEPAVAHGSSDYCALDVLSEMLGADGGFDTRLVDDLQVRQGLALDVSSNLESGRYRGSIEFHLTAEPKKIAQAVAALRGELRRLQDDPVGPFELERARTKIVAGGFVSEESTQVVAARVHRIGLDGLPLDYERSLPKRYDALDGAALERAAQTYLRPDSLVEVYEGPQP